MMTRFTRAGAVTLAVFAILQWIPVITPGSAPVRPGLAIESNLRVPPPVERMLDKACADCHTSRTRWPWYANVAPLRWLIAKDVERARRAVNFSEWAAQAGRRPGTAIGVLAAACEGVRTQRMPPAPYRLMHPDAHLTPTDEGTFCEWAYAAMRELRPGTTKAD